MANIYDMADTWNDGATTFTAIKINVTDTASTGSSLLMDLQVGGASRFRISKSGVLTLFRADGLESGTISIGSANNKFSFSKGLFVSNPGGLHMFVNESTLSWGENGNLGDLILARDAANTLAQRNGANAQAFRLYNTYSDASNYERGFMKWNSNVLEIGTEAAGTGTHRNVIFRRGGAIRIAFDTDSDNSISFAPAGATRAIFVSSGNLVSRGIIALATDQIGFSSSTSTNANNTNDVAIARDAAGVMKVTDGGAGAGQLIFIVPTTDPGIPGALWNNAGTLAISA